MRLLARLLFWCLFTATVLVVPSPTVAAPPAPVGGAAVAWGDEFYGQTDVAALPPGLTYTAISGGSFHSLGLLSDGTVVGWGLNDQGQTDVPALPPGLVYTAVAAGAGHSLALRSDGNVIAWGSTAEGWLDVPALPPGLTYTAISASNTHSLALRSDGSAVGWGNGGDGQTTVPPLPPGVTYTAVSAGSFFSLGLRSDGTAIGWGWNGVGEADVPAPPNGLTYTAISAGSQHGIALTSAGTVVGWGADSHGRLDAPALPSGVTYTAIDAGSQFNLGLTSEGDVVAWGENFYHQTEVPPGLDNAVAISAGAMHGLAIQVDDEQAITFTSTPPAYPTIGESYQVAATGGGSGNPIVYSVHPDTTNNACTVTGDVVRFERVGECWVQADQAGGGGFLPGHAVQQVGSVKHGQTIDTSYLPRAAVVGMTFPLNAYGEGSDKPVTFTSTTPAVCTTTPGGSVTYLSAGTCVLQLDVAGNADYHPASPVTWQVMVVSHGWGL